MNFSAIHTLTLLDYPGKIAAIVFTPGCNMRCHFCHNAEFVLPEELKKIQHDFIPSQKVLNFLKKRQGKLDGLVISGGEPTIHSDLLDFMRQVKDLGFLVKLDTNGTNPEVVQKALSEKLVDYMAMDIKATPKKYDDIAGVKINKTNIEKTKKLIQNSDIEYEFRTTIIKGFHNEKMLEEIFRFCQGCQKFTIQNYRNGKTLNPEWKKYTGFRSEELNQIKKIAEQYIEKVLVHENT
jgi:pyruvate formate lyase activating enzyme